MKKVFLSFVATFCIFIAFGQTVGLIQHSDSTLDDGYVLFSPSSSTNTYLIDMCGRQVKSWSSTYRPGHMVYLLPDGHLLRTGILGNPIFIAGGNGGIIEKIDWTNKVVWSYKVSDNMKCQHHDVKALPNGNLLVIAWESKNNTDAINQGRDPKLTSKSVWSEQILEIKPIGKDSGEVVWEWHLWDHLVQDFDPLKLNYASVASNPQLMDINFEADAGIQDWIHLNSIDYNPTLDQIVLSSHNTNEIWIIDHSTTKIQSATHSGGKAGKGGDILYRWGNPRAYRKGTTADQKFFGQHNAQWIENGFPYANNILVYNNGANRTGGPDSLYTTVEIIKPPVTGFTYSTTVPYLPINQLWMYNKGNPYNYYAVNISGAQLLKNGNLLLCNGPAGSFTEITLSGKTVWEYINPVSNTGILKQNEPATSNVVFRCTFYPYSYSGFTGKTLLPGMTIEDKNPKTDSCKLKLSVSTINKENNFTVYPNPASDILNVSLAGIYGDKTTLKLINSLGQIVKQHTITGFSTSISVSLLPKGLYFVQIQNEDLLLTKKLMLE